MSALHQVPDQHMNPCVPTDEIQYLGQYRVNRRGKSELRKLARRSGIVIDWSNFKLLEEDFDLVPEKDNKSVWTPRAILEGLSRYTCEVPTSLVQRIEAISTWGGTAATNTREADQATYRKGAPALPADSSTTGTISDAGSGRSEPSMGEEPFSGGRGACLPMVRGRGRRGIFAHDWDPAIYERAFNAAFREAGRGARRFSPLAPAEVLDDHVHRTSYAGLPYLCRNDDVDRSVILGEVDLILRTGKSIPPTLVGKRTSHGLDRPKSRLVWMAPLAATVLDTCLAKGLSSTVQARNCFAYRSSFRQVGSRIVDMQSKRRFVYGLDFSGFDASLNAKLIEDAFSILRSHLELDAMWAKYWRRMVDNFIHTRIVLPDGSIWQVHRGVPSGSAFTSLVDSVCNLIIVNYIWIKLTGRAPRSSEVNILGDDSVVASDWYLDRRDIESAALDLGMILSVDKSRRVRLGERVPFLGHEWKCGQPHRNERDIAVRLAFPERYTELLKDDRYSLYRMFSMAGDSVEGLEIFYKYVPWLSDNLDQIVRDVMFNYDVQSLLRDMSDRELLRALPGRTEFRVRVEGADYGVYREFSPKLIHVGRIT